MEQKEKKGPTDAEVNATFDKLSREFDSLWINSPKDFEKFESLKQRAKLMTLYPRQMDAIIARCNNVINGSYGNTKAGVSFSSPQDAKK